VPFSATDNLSGFAPQGALSINLASETTSGEGTDLIVTSDGIYDRAGNFASGIVVGPFKVDMTAPIITAGKPIGTPGGPDWWKSDVTVPFSATDNVSGFEPNGALTTDLDPKTTSGEGTNLMVTSDGVYDVAGNFAPGIDAGPFIVIKADTAGLTGSANSRNFRAFFEILNIFRVVSNEPVTPTTFFGYHPLIHADLTAFDNLGLDIGAYDFISDNIKMKRPLSPYLGGS
jgi:hypothetical protein